MAKSQPKIVLAPAQGIAFNLLVLSQANVRRVKDGVTIEQLADDIEHRGLLQSLSVRPQLDGEGMETGKFEVPAGGRRFRALQILVKRKRLASTALVPCVVKPADDPVSADEDSYAENVFRENLHPLDEFRGMQELVAQGNEVEAVAARFRVTPAVVRQRLKLASVSPALHEVYAADGMTLDQLMAFSVSDDHARQEQVWELVQQHHNQSPHFIRARLTETTVSATDPRVRFVGIPEHHRTNFDTLLRAAADNALALMECADAATGEPRYVLCAVGFDDGAYLMTPFGHLAEGDPFAAYRPPEAGAAAA